MNEQSLEKPTALSAAQSALLEQWREGHTRLTGSTPIRTRDGGDRFPLSLAQRRLWFIEQLRPGTAAYNLCFCASIDGEIDPDMLAKSLDDLVRRHQVLQVRILVQDGNPYQIVDADAGPKLELIDLRAADAGAAMAAAIEHAERVLHKPFVLQTGPLACVVLCRLPGRSVLVLVVHHLIADGWSLGVALKELSAIYLARARHIEPTLPPLKLQYGDFAAWQSELSRESEWSESLAYWRDELRDAPPLEVPTDHPRPPIISPRGDWQKFRLSSSLSDSLRALAKAEHATLFTLLLAALSLMLCKLNGQRDVVVGTATANRHRPETFGMVGNFINLVALRTRIDGDPTFRQLLQQVRRKCLSGFAHQQVPFERVVEELHIDRDLSRSTLFQTLLVLQPPLRLDDFAGLSLTPIEVGSHTARADLEFHLWDERAVCGRLSYSTDLFDEPSMTLLLQRFTAVLEQIANDPDRRFSTLSAVLPAELQDLRRRGGGKEQSIVALPAHELISEHVDRDDRPAVVFRNQHLSYRQLIARANRLANYLRSKAVGPESLVAVCVPRSPDMLVAVLGVLKAGAAYVPLDPEYPPARRELIAKNAQAAALVTVQSLLGHVDMAGTPIVCLDRDDATICTFPDRDPGVEVDPANLAYVIYTSGSSGVPKGVQITHRALTNLIFSLMDEPGIGRNDIQLAVASLSFDASVAELFPILAAGGTLVIAAGEDVVNGTRLKQLLSDHSVTILQATATTWQMLRSCGGLVGSDLTALCGGEPTPPDLAETLVRRYARVWNMYGPTEATVWSCMQRLTAGGPISLGRPLLNTQIYVLDEDLQEVPVGVIGELCIGGFGPARGYLGQPARTAECFVPSPFESGKRIYRTGDLVRYRRNDALEFVGRRDFQIKLRGHRIELGEIETVLAACPEVESIVVTVGELPSGMPALVAYVVPASPAHAKDEAGTTQLLLLQLRRRLPEYMIPTAFEFLERLPITATGKVDRLHLPPPARKRMELDRYVEPRTALEAEIAQMVKSLLGLDRIGVRDDFFNLGGHSLLAASFVADLRSRYDIQFLLEDLFTGPTVEHVAANVTAQRARKLRIEDEAAQLNETIQELPDHVVDELLARIHRDLGASHGEA